MKFYKTIATHKATGERVIIESEYPTKKNFIDDVRKNGYAVNPIKVKESSEWDRIMDETNADITDWQPNYFENLSKRIARI